MNIAKYLFGIGLGLTVGLGLTSCNDDDFTESIFPDVSDEPSASSATYKFDKWLNDNFRDVYNMTFGYRLDDTQTDYNYNVSPASLENSMKMAVLTKYVWYDAYAEAYGGSIDNLDPGFVKNVGPKMITLIGSYMHNTSTGTVTLGYASGGVQITLCAINESDFNDISQLNNRYFHTMHHEYCHILHQTKNYPTEFNLLSNGRYDSSNWNNRNGGVCASMGFVTPYAGMNSTEDFAETVSNYITRTDKDFEMINWCAQRGWSTGSDSDDDKDLSVAYCYYFYKDDNARNKDIKTPTLRYNADNYNTNVTLVDSDYGIYSTPAEVEEYIKEKSDELKAQYKENQAWERYDMAYSQLNGDQKTVIDVLADGMQFMFPYEDSDKIDGLDIMEQKLNIARNWFRDSWGLDLDNLRVIVQRRSADYNLDALLQQIYDVPLPADK